MSYQCSFESSISGDGGSVAFLGCLFQCLTTLTVKESIFLCSVIFLNVTLGRKDLLFSDLTDFFFFPQTFVYVLIHWKMLLAFGGVWKLFKQKNGKANSLFKQLHLLNLSEGILCLPASFSGKNAMMKKQIH